MNGNLVYHAVYIFFGDVIFKDIDWNEKKNYCIVDEQATYTELDESFFLFTLARSFPSHFTKLEYIVCKRPAKLLDLN